MPWLIDGNNVAGGGDRARVRAAALAVARGERVRLVVFFDGAPPPGSPPVEVLGRVEIRYVRVADQAIANWLARAGGHWRLATDDRGLAVRARSLGAEIVGTAEFWRKAQAATAGAGETSRPAVDVERELAWFKDPGHRMEPGGRRPARRPSRRSPG